MEKRRINAREELQLAHLLSHSGRPADIKRAREKAPLQVRTNLGAPEYGWESNGALGSTSSLTEMRKASGMRTPS